MVGTYDLPYCPLGGVVAGLVAFVAGGLGAAVFPAGGRAAFEAGGAVFGVSELAGALAASASISLIKSSVTSNFGLTKTTLLCGFETSITSV